MIKIFCDSCQKELNSMEHIDVSINETEKIEIDSDMKMFGFSRGHIHFCKDCWNKIKDFLSMMGVKVQFEE